MHNSQCSIHNAQCSMLNYVVNARYLFNFAQCVTEGCNRAAVRDESRKGHYTLKTITIVKSTPLLRNFCYGNRFTVRGTLFPRRLSRLKNRITSGPPTGDSDCLQAQPCADGRRATHMARWAIVPCTPPAEELAIRPGGSDCLQAQPGSFHDGNQFTVRGTLSPRRPSRLKNRITSGPPTGEAIAPGASPGKKLTPKLRFVILRDA